ncbi:prepilin peptidase [Solidesulfovibrio alcoholivorans]|uniref:prepilin peptidase n=1 Tax=Solidesulfovibrio alcoholivorans TaxID=81406 RepID=UPI000497EAAA|nr:A24 family peptidase [Solidesulfovibrio alcoholivorans]
MPQFLSPALFPYVFPAFAAVLGLVLGSFYSVCVSRGIAGTSIVRPASHCPHCGHPLAWWELLPLVSYLLLRGRCAACRERISALYPLIELASAAWAALAAAAFGPSWWFVAYLALGGLYIVASGIDFQIYLLPNFLTYPAAALGIAIGATRPDIGPMQAVIGAVAGFGVFWLLAAGFRLAKGVDGLGGGDVKLMLSIGGACGVLGLPYAVLVGSLAALLASPFYVLGKGRGRSMPIPFGPFLCFGAMAYILYGPALLRLLTRL